MESSGSRNLEAAETRRQGKHVDTRSNSEERESLVEDRDDVRSGRGAVGLVQ